ncbi:threonine dehydratase [Amycolatopsis antarctica]|uniref:L-threonine dehydratase n=1 Tax=Amycolatopsis antarctica TaxID=1854586 RepID=A0A263CWU1_9PSEU|nr:threonine ammonia-lyase IlvA [Amycolatopsis antarctica]OZM70449.1 threonine dehydratase [Amycolatopsis antarctica]
MASAENSGAAATSRTVDVLDTATVTAADVDRARERLRGVTASTPLTRNERLSDRAAGEVWVKREDLQPVRSYKLRGAYNLMAQLPSGAASAGVVCASAGNHAQGVAYACAALGIEGRVYLPRTTPRQKRERIAAIGGERVRLVVSGDAYDDAQAAAAAFAESTGALVVSAFDDPRTVAGQGTVACEIVEQLGVAPDRIVVPVGGGGLLAGMAAWLRERHPGVRLIGVEPSGAASMTAALAAGRPVALPEVDPFVDGAAVRRVGRTPFPIVRDSGTEVLTLDAGAVCVEMLDLYQTDGIIAEPAGALATGSLGDVLTPEPGSVTVCVLSGGNNDVSRYSEILERALVFEGLKHYFLVDFPQEPGMLRRFLDKVLGPDDDITLFEYVKRNNRETGPALVGVEIGDRGDLPGLLKRMMDSPLRIEPVDPDSALFRFLL